MKISHITVASILACSLCFGLDLALEKQKNEQG